MTNINTLPSNTIDCFIVTQTLNFIYDVKSAVRGIFHMLKDGGIILATVAGISQISRYDMDRWGDYWRFTDLFIKQSECLKGANQGPRDRDTIVELGVEQIFASYDNPRGNADTER